MADPIPSPIADTLEDLSESPVKLSRLKEYQLDIIAKLSVMNANSPEQIAITTGISLTQLNYLLSGRSNKFNTIQNGYREQISQHFHGAKFDMIEKLPLCSKALDDALNSGDIRIARDTAFEIMDRVLPDMDPRRRNAPAESNFSISITQNNPQAAILLNNTMDSVADMMKDLKEHLTLDGDTINHELLGNEALPIPPGQLQVSDGEALPLLEDSDQGEWLDLVPMAEFPGGD